MDKLYILFGMIGAICFLIGDILLGWVDPETVDKRTHSYITEGHGKGDSRSKIAVTMTLAAIGIPFLYSIQKSRLVLYFKTKTHPIGAEKTNWSR